MLTGTQRHGCPRSRTVARRRHVSARRARGPLPRRASVGRPVVPAPRRLARGLGLAKARARGGPGRPGRGLTAARSGKGLPVAPQFFLFTEDIDGSFLKELTTQPQAAAPRVRLLRPLRLLRAALGAHTGWLGKGPRGPGSLSLTELGRGGRRGRLPARRRAARPCSGASRSRPRQRPDPGRGPLCTVPGPPTHVLPAAGWAAGPHAPAEGPAAGGAELEQGAGVREEREHWTCPSAGRPRVLGGRPRQGGRACWEGEAGRPCVPGWRPRRGGRACWRQGGGAQCAFPEALARGERGLARLTGQRGAAWASGGSQHPPAP